jgi:hypothetical protein
MPRAAARERPAADIDAGQQAALQPATRYADPGIGVDAWHCPSAIAMTPPGN